MDKSRRHDKQAGVGVGGRLRQRLAQMLLHTSCAATTTSATAFVGLAGRTTTSAVAASHHEPPSPRARPRGAHHDHEPLSFSGAAVGDGSSSCQRRRRRHHRRHDARALVHISIDCSARLSVAAAAVL